MVVGFTVIVRVAFPINFCLHIGKLPQQYARAINKIKEFRTAIGEISVEKSGISVTTKSRTLSVCNTNIPSHFSVSGTLDANINIIMFQRTNKT